MNYKTKYSISIFIIWVLFILLGYQIKMADHLQKSVKYRFENHIDHVELKALKDGKWGVVFKKKFDLKTQSPFTDWPGLEKSLADAANVAFNRGMWDSVEWEMSARLRNRLLRVKMMDN